MDNMLLGAKDQPGEKLLTALVRPLWSKREAEIREKAEDLLARFKLDTQEGRLRGQPLRRPAQAARDGAGADERPRR